MINQLFSNPYFFVPFVTWILGQSLKFLINLFYGRFDFKYLVASGGMPSVHTGVVISLTTVAALEDGFSSPLFGALLVLSGIVVYDSFGVRRASGEQAKLLNTLIEDLTSRRELGKNYEHLRVFLGHKPIEVLVGAFLGVAMGLLLTKFAALGAFLSPQFLFGIPKSFPFLMGFLVAAGTMVVLSILIKGVAMIREFKGAKKKLVNWLFWWLLAGGLFTLIYGAAAYETVSVVSFPIIFALGALIWLYFGSLIARYYTKKFPHEHSEWLEKERKEKYLP